MTLKALYIELYYGEYSYSERRKKLIEYIDNNENTPAELLELYPNYEPLLLSVIQIKDSEFSSNCLEAEILAAKFFLDVLADYKNGNLNPLKLCKIFSNLEKGFLDAPRGLENNIAYYPEWIGDLYDACDWCDETWTIENSPHLIDAIQHQINVIHGWLLKPI
ncbi:hypothetical protein [Acinetobacter sp. YH12097]|uniref:hypothetical protein n=1 Tax=Acinetobacter sp. YH12097 TaxID=2601086 RepID=UPI0015D43517|nr:hypothetical protein [Acinetobacter sp. YH12097]